VGRDLQFRNKHIATPVIFYQISPAVHQIQVNRIAPSTTSMRHDQFKTL
jgi:hypothetical protein